MTKDEALKLALVALVRDDRISGAPNNKKTITAIREALAQPEQEPVATLAVRWHEPVGKVSYVLDVNLPVGIHKVYTTPPQRKPLTNDEIDEKWRKATEHPALTSEFVRSFARDIEATHGIKE